jgi:hypothetical protein
MLPCWLVSMTIAIVAFTGGVLQVADAQCG